MTQMDNATQQKLTPIKVFIRVRPKSKQQDKSHSVIEITENKTVNITSDLLSKSTIQSDQAFPETSSQKELFQHFKAPIIKFIEGYNLTIFAYGQTGSGKTHTMFGNKWQSFENSGFVFQLENPDFEQSLKQDENQAGIIPRAIYHLFQQLEAEDQKTQQSKYRIYCSFLQIYNEKVYDLFQDPLKSKQLEIHQSNVDGAFVEGLTEFNVKSSLECLNLLKYGRKNCLSKHTLMSTKSSKSHNIFQLSLESLNPDQNGLLRKAKLTLCDLAGSQKINKEEKLKEQQLKELKNINKSLTTLGKVITSLSSKLKQIYAPFRESKLTRLLQQSLTASTQTFIIGNISPSSLHIDDTMNTLKFVQKARHIAMKIKPSQCDVGNPGAIHQMKKEILYLKQLLKLKKKGVTPQDIQVKLAQLESENQRLKKDVVPSKDFSKIIAENYRLKEEIHKLHLVLNNLPIKKSKLHVKSSESNNDKQIKIKVNQNQVSPSRKQTQISKIIKYHERKARSKSEIKDSRESESFLPQIQSPKRTRGSSQHSKVSTKSKLYEPKPIRKQRYSSEPRQLDIDTKKQLKPSFRTSKMNQKEKLREFLSQNKQPPYFLSAQAQNCQNLDLDQSQSKISKNPRRRPRKNHLQRRIEPQLPFQFEQQILTQRKSKTKKKQSILQKLSELEKAQKINQEKIFNDLEKGEKKKPIMRLNMAQNQKRYKTIQSTISTQKKVEKIKQEKGHILIRQSQKINYEERIKYLESKINEK